MPVYGTSVKLKKATSGGLLDDIRPESIEAAVMRQMPPETILLRWAVVSVSDDVVLTDVLAVSPDTAQRINAVAEG